MDRAQAVTIFSALAVLTGMQAFWIGRALDRVHAELDRIHTELDRIHGAIEGLDARVRDLGERVSHLEAIRSS